MVIISARDSGKKRQSQGGFSLSNRIIFKPDLIEIHKETNK